MNLLFIFGIILMALILFVVLKVAKRLIKVVFSLIFILLLISLVFGFFVFRDFQDFQENFFDSKNTFLVQKNGTITMGFSAIGFVEDKALLNDQEIQELQQYYEQKDFLSMVDDEYKIFIIDMQIAPEDMQDFSMDVIFEQAKLVEVIPESPMFMAIKYLPWLANFKSGVNQG